MKATQLTPAIRESDHHRGPLDAPIQLVEYGDFECGYCRLAYPQLERYVKEFGHKVCFVFRNFPLVNSHPFAMRAAMAAEAANRQNQFWHMHHLLYRTQNSFTEESINQFAQTLGLNMTQFEKDIESPELVDHIQRDFNSGVNSGVNGTPTLYLNGYKFNGGATYKELLTATQDLLSGAKSNSPDSQPRF